MSKFKTPSVFLNKYKNMCVVLHVYMRGRNIVLLTKFYLQNLETEIRWQK